MSVIFRTIKYRNVWIFGWNTNVLTSLFLFPGPLLRLYYLRLCLRVIFLIFYVSIREKLEKFLFLNSFKAKRDVYDYRSLEGRNRCKAETTVPSLPLEPSSRSRPWLLWSWHLIYLDSFPKPSGRTLVFISFLNGSWYFVLPIPILDVTEPKDLYLFMI